MVQCSAVEQFCQVIDAHQLLQFFFGMASLLKLILQYMNERHAHRDEEQHHGTEGIKALRPVPEDMFFGTPDKNDKLGSWNVSEGIQTLHPIVEGSCKEAATILSN